MSELPTWVGVDFLAACGPRPDGVGRRNVPVGVAVSDVWFVFLTLIVFGLLAVIVKGVERL